MQVQQREAAEGMIARACVLVDHGMMEEASALLARAALAYQQVYMCPHTTRLRAPSLLEPLSPTSRFIYVCMHACVGGWVCMHVLHMYISWYIHMYICI